MTKREICEKLFDIYNGLRESADNLTSCDECDRSVAWGYLDSNLDKLEDLIDEIDEETTK